VSAVKSKIGLTGIQEKIFGRLVRDELPVYARNEFLRAGLKLAEHHYVVHWVRAENGRVASGIHQYDALPWVGLGAGIVFFLAGALVAILKGPLNRPQPA
jgi:hypothetical protein